MRLLLLHQTEFVMQYQSLTCSQVSTIRKTLSTLGFSVRRNYSGSVSLRPRKGNVLTVGLAKQVSERLAGLNFLELTPYEETFKTFFAFESETIISEQFFSGLFARA